MHGHYLFFILTLILSSLGYAQDERYYRQILSGELPKQIEPFNEAQEGQFNIRGARYHFDLDGDGNPEIIEPQKRDGVDALEIRSASGKVLFLSKLLASGVDGHIYKIRFVHLSSKTKALIIFFDEGVTASRKVESVARIFVLTFDNNNFDTFKLTQGPHFFHEKESQRDQYVLRTYNVDVVDIDGDGTREILVNSNHIQRIMKYKGRGNWSRY